MLITKCYLFVYLTAINYIYFIMREAKRNKGQEDRFYNHTKYMIKKRRQYIEHKRKHIIEEEKIKRYKPKKEDIDKLKNSLDDLYLNFGCAIMVDGKMLVKESKEQYYIEQEIKLHDSQSKYVNKNISKLAVKLDIIKGNFIFKCCSCKEEMPYTEIGGKKNINFTIKDDLSINYNRCNRCFNEYMKNKKLENDLFRISCNLRSTVAERIKRKGYNKKSKTYKILGCSFEYLMSYLENMFLEGMSWDNWGKWHIDHIVPLCSANTEEELITLCNYKNLQPLWSSDNFSKSGTYKEEDKIKMLNTIKNHNKL